jgi:hypothetical protein
MFLVIVGLILLFAILTAKPGVERARAAKLGDFNIPRAKYGDPVPIIWGTVKLQSPIVIWIGDYNPEPIKKKGQVVGYKNYLGLDCLLCIGPSIRLRRIWAGKYLAWEGLTTGVQNISIDLPKLFGDESQLGGIGGNLTFYDGRFNPAQDSYLIQHLGSNVPSYNGYCRVLFKSFYVGNSPNLQSFSFEVSKITNNLHATYSVMANGLDLNPLEIAYNLITEKWGTFGNLSSVIDLTSFVTAAEILYNENLGMSLSAQSSVTGKDLLEEIMRHCDGILYQDSATSKITCKLIRQDYDIEELITLDESNVSEVKNFVKTTWDNTFNQCRVTFKDRAANYEDSVSLTQDFANINFQSRIKSTEISSPGCFTAEVANKLAVRQLSILSVPLFKCDIVCNRQALSLRPGDCFVLNWEPYNLTNMIMRVAKIDFGELTSNEIKINCVQDKFATNTAVFANTSVSNWTPIDTSANEVSSFRIWEPPHFLSCFSIDESLEQFRENLRIYLLANKPSSSSISFDAYTYPTIGGVTEDAIAPLDTIFEDSPIVALEDAPYNGSGTLAADYSASSDWLTRHRTSGLTIENVSSATLANLKQAVSLDEVRDGSAMFLINDELFIYVGFVDNEDGSVTFNDVYRSILNTIPENHEEGNQVWFISGLSGLCQPLLRTVNYQFYLASIYTNIKNKFAKFIDKTVRDSFQISEAEIEFCDSNDIKGAANKPYQPQDLRINGEREPDDLETGSGTVIIEVSWAHRSRLRKQIEVFSDIEDPNNSNGAAMEPGTRVRIDWRVGLGAYTTLYSTGENRSVDIDVSGYEGTLEVLTYGQVIATSVLSEKAERITMTLI